MDLSVGDEAVRHADRLEDHCLDVERKLLTAHGLDKGAENLVVCVRIFPSCPGFIGRRPLRNPFHLARKLVLAPGQVGVRVVALQGRIAAGVAQQLPDGDCARGAA